MIKCPEQSKRIAGADCTWHVTRIRLWCVCIRSVFLGRACTEIDLNIFVYFTQVTLWIEAEQHLLFACFFQAFITNCRFKKNLFMFLLLLLVSYLKILVPQDRGCCIPLHSCNSVSSKAGWQICVVWLTSPLPLGNETAFAIGLLK